jgi:phage gp37-like protein
MIDKVASAIRDAPLGSLYVTVNVCSEPLPVDGETETGYAVPGSAVLVFKHPERNKAQQRITTKRMFELPSQSKIQTCVYGYTESSKGSLRASCLTVQSPKTCSALGSKTSAEFAVELIAGIKEQ